MTTVAIRDDRGMVAGRRGITRKEIAEKYNRGVHTVSQTWAAHEDFPDPIGKRGKYLEYDPDEVERFLRATFLPADIPEGNPEELVTVDEAAARAGIEPDTLRSQLSRGRDWPEPVVVDGVKLFQWGPMRERLLRRRRFRQGGSAASDGDAAS